MVPEVLNKRLRTIDWIAASVLLAGVAATLAAGVLPVTSRARANNRSAETYRHELAKLDGLKNTLSQVETELERTHHRLALAETRMPTTGAMDQFMVQLAKVADDSGLQVEGITPKPLQDAASYKVMPVEISGTGTFETCYTFLTGLRKMNRLTRLDDLVVQLQQSGADRERPPGQPVCRVTVGISTFMAR